MLQIGARLIQAREAIAMRGRAVPEPAQLREDEPHPVTALSALRELAADLLDHSCLRAQEALELKGIAGELAHRICSKVHCRGALSGRQRSSRVPCRKRSPVTWSKLTSTTSVGLSGCHSPLRCVLQRLGPPGLLPVKPGGARSASSRRVSAARSACANVEVKPTWCSRPSASYRPSNSDPTSRPLLA